MANDLDDLQRQALTAIAAAEAGEKGLEARGQCQACFREFAIKPTAKSSNYIDSKIPRGKLGLVLHGFERPGFGYLKGMCIGAGHPPYEISCEVTKEWHASLRDVVLPRQKQQLFRLRSGEAKTFTYKYDKYVTSPQGRSARKTFGISVTEGEPLPSGYPSDHGPPNFTRLRSIAIGNAELDIKHTESEISFLASRIKNWTFSPEKLGRGIRVEELAGAKWFENRQVQALMEKMPAPDGKGSFMSWAMRFPHTLAWMTMRGTRSPRFYQKVREEFNQQPMAIAAGLAVKPAEKKVDVSGLPPEAAEKQKAKEAKTAEQNAKAGRVMAVIEALLGDQRFTDYLRSRDEQTSEYDHGDVRYAYPNRSRKAQPGKPTLLDNYRMRIARGNADSSHTDRMHTLKRVATELKDVAGRVGIKVKLPKMTGLIANAAKVC